MHPTAHKLRETIKQERPVLGTFLVEFTGSAVVHVLAEAGFDFVMIDCEHGNHGPREVEMLLEAATHAGVCALVRPPTTSRDMITRVLDAGAAGVLVPAIDTMEQVHQAVRATKYRPLGKRGVHLLRGHTRHRKVNPATFLAEANRDVLTLIQIELEGAVALAEQIAATEGVDGLYVGPGDLSVDLGVPCQWNAPDLQAAIKKVSEACRAHGKIMACHADRIEDMPRLQEMGVQMFGYFCDIGLFQASAAAVAADFRSALERRVKPTRKQGLSSAHQDPHRVYWKAQMEEAYGFMETMLHYPVEECGEALDSLEEVAAAAKVEVEFSSTKIVNEMDRVFRLRRGLIPGLIAAAREMNARGWVLKVEDGFRSRPMQKLLARKPTVFDAILTRVVWELDGEIPSTNIMFRRLSSLVASRPKVGTHMSGSAIDISVLRRDDRTEIDRGGPYLTMSEATPMGSPFVSEQARRNRIEITTLMARHGFEAYPYEFWHYSQGDAYAEHLADSGKPARYGAVDWNASDNSVTPIERPETPLNSDAEVESEIEHALRRMG